MINTSSLQHTTYVPLGGGGLGSNKMLFLAQVDQIVSVIPLCKAGCVLGGAAATQHKARAPAVLGVVCMMGSSQLWCLLSVSQA